MHTGIVKPLGPNREAALSAYAFTHHHPRICEHIEVLGDRLSGNVGDIAEL